VAIISGLGILVAASLDLTAPTKSQAAEQPASGPPPIAVYDPADGSAPTLRLDTPAQTRLVAVQRHYELASEHQAVIDTNYQLLADSRHRALVDEAGETEDNQTRIFAERQHRQIAAAAKAKLEEVRKALAAAWAEAEQRRAQGLEPPANALELPAGTTTTTTTTSTGNGQGGALPIASGVIGARFGAYGSWSSYHTGVDFRAPYGEPIHAAAAGVVVFAGNTGDWSGNHVAVQHADGMTTMYSHMSWIGATVGEQVTAGQVIGRVGQTGRAFGPHLHFEVYPPGVRFGDVYRAVDPLPWLANIGVHTR
jgi:murein DD-endopeptidase MepM/ murein hydrolase activator NlpD